jgi:SAM-dependent methyltransferase
MAKDTEFYNRISESYSGDRYPETTNSYTQFFFKRRLELLVHAIEQTPLTQREGLSVLEIGCADGVVLRKIFEIFKKNFSYFVGLDISPKMIEAAARLNSNTGMLFKVRNDYHDLKKFNVVLEVGVINYTNSVQDEMKYVHSVLEDGGYYICSFAGTNSLLNKIKPGDKVYQNFMTYQEYEQIMQEFFVIEKKIPVGFFVPLLWRFPVVARFKQSVVENMFRYISPNFFHENIYVLRSK